MNSNLKPVLQSTPSETERSDQKTDTVGCMMCMFSASNFCLCQILPYMMEFDGDEQSNDFLRIL